MKNYWSGVTQRRISRRRALALTAGGAAGAAFLAACGDDDDDGGGAATGSATGATGGATGTTGGTGTAASGLLAEVQDVSAQATTGGTLKWWGQEANNLDSLLTESFSLSHPSILVYAHPVRETPGYLGPPERREYQPDMAESWEISGDQMQITFHLRQNMPFHNKPPVSGRIMDSGDWTASWERFVGGGQARELYANSINPNAPIVNMTATDNHTVVVELARPDATVLGLLGWADGGRYWVTPKEAGVDFDPQSDMIGTGPFMLLENNAGLGMKFERHDGYYDDKGRPWIQTIESPFIEEYTTGVAQFRAGAIYNYDIGAEDIIPLKNDLPHLNIYQRNDMTPWGYGFIGFGWESEFNKDERFRQALSMAFDRDLWLDTTYNLTEFEENGISLPRGWGSTLNAGGGGWYLDPQGSDFGPNAKYYTYNVEEAKKLLAAAGHPDGIELKSYRLTNLIIGSYEQNTQIGQGMLEAIGVRTNMELLDYFTAWRDFRNNQGGHDDIAFLAGPFPNHPTSLFFQRVHSQAGPGSAGQEPDAYVDETIEAMIGEFDVDSAIQLAHDLQRHLAEKMYYVPQLGAADELYMTWPVIRNAGVETGDYGRSGDYPLQGAFNWFLDETQEPVGS